MTRLADLPVLDVKTNRIGGTVWDYRVFLCRGMSNVRKQTADKMLKNPAQVDGFRATRLPLVLALRDQAETQFDESPSHRTFVSNYQTLRDFYGYCDQHDLDPMAKNIVDLFIDWAEGRRSSKQPMYHYTSATRLVRMLSEVTDIRSDRFKIPARLVKPPGRGNRGRVDAQDLEKTFRFGELMTVVSTILSTETIMGPLPLKFRFGERTPEL